MKQIKIFALFALVGFFTSQSANAQELKQKETELKQAIEQMGIKNYQIALQEVKGGKVVGETVFGNKDMSRVKQVYKEEKTLGDPNAKKLSIYISRTAKDKWTIYISSATKLAPMQLDQLSKILGQNK